MKGFIVRHMGRETKVGLPDSWVSLVCTLVMQREEFIFEGGGLSKPFVSSFQKIREGIGIEIEVAEFDISSEIITKDNETSEIDPEYIKMIESRDEEWELKWKLKKFHEIERVLKSEGLLD